MLLPAGRRPRLLGDKLHMLAEAVSLDRFDEVYPRLVSHWALDAELAPGEGSGAGRLEPIGCFSGVLNPKPEVPERTQGDFGR